MDPIDKINQLAQLNALSAGPAPGGKSQPTEIDRLNALAGAGMANKDQYKVGSDLDAGLLPDMDQNEYRARNQSVGRLIKNASVHGLSEVVLGSLEGAGYLADMDELSGLADQTEDEFGNWFSDLMKKGKEEIKDATPIYTTKEGKEFAPGDATWWASNAESIASSLSLLIPTTGAVKGLTMAGKAMGLGKIMTSRLGRDVAKGIAGGMISRRMENTMEASGVFNQTYDQALQQNLEKGLSQETAEFNAKQTAGEAARNDWYANNVNLATDIAQQFMLLRGMGGLKPKGPTIGALAKQMTSEAAEEASQFVIAEEARNAALSTEFDFFGKGFGSRLTDYLGDDELKTSAFFGGLGGGVFGGAGPLVKKGIDKLMNAPDPHEAIAKQRALAVGDLDKVRAIEDINFGKLAFSHVLKGQTDSLRDNLNDLKEDPKADEKDRHRLDNYIEDLEFMDERYRALSDDTRIPTEAVKPILGLEYEHRMRSKAYQESTKDLIKERSEMVGTGEVDAAALVLKAKELEASAYNRLAKESGQIRFAGKAAEVFNEFQELYKGWIGMNPHKSYQEESAVANRLSDKVFNNVSQLEKLNDIRKDVALLNTPSGYEVFKARRAEAKAEADAAKAVASKDAKPEDLKKATKSKNPEVKKAAEKKLEVVKEEKKETAKGKIEKAKTPKSNLSPKEKSDHDAAEAALFGITIPAPNVPDSTPNQGEVFNGEDAPTELVERVHTEKKPEKTEPAERKQSTIQREDPGAKTVLKELAGKWEVVDGKEVFVKEVFVKELNPDTTPKIQDYFYSDDSGKKNPIPVYEVFDSIDKNLLTVNTPLIQEGDEVIIKRDQEWPFFKTQDPESVVYNVFRSVNGKAVGKPLTQIPSAKNPKTSTAQSNELRKKLNEAYDNGAKSVRTTISYKNVGDFINLRNPDGTPVTNSIEILEEDWTGKKNSKTSHKPILAYIDAAGVIQVPQVQRMKNISDTEVNKVNEMEKVSQGAPGTVLTLRTNSKGGYTPAQLDPRKINEEELNWLRTNLAQYLAEKRYEDIKTLIHIENADITDNISIYNKSNRLVNYAGDIAFFVGGEKPFWVKINAAGKFGENFSNFMSGQPFKFQYYTAQGEKVHTLQESQNIKAELYARIKAAFDETLATQYKNIDKNFINSESNFTDVLGKTYNTYYDYIKETNSVYTDLPKGFSFYNATIYLDTNLKAGKPIRDVGQDKKVTIVKETPPPSNVIPKTSTPAKPEEKKKIDWDDVKEDLDKRFKTADPTGPFKIISEKELSWMKERFGPEYLSIAEGVDSIMSKGGTEAYGIYHNAMITLAQYAEAGTGYHEAFHFAFDVMLSEPQKRKVLDIAKRKFKLRPGAMSIDARAEEKLAEDFEKYMLSNGKYRPVVEASRSLFRKILDYIKRALGYKDSIERLFEDVANFKPKDAMAILKEYQRLGTEPRTKLVPGMTKVNQQKEAIQAATFELIQLAMTDAGKASYDDILTAPGNLEKYVDQVKKGFEKAAKDLNVLKAGISAGTIESTPELISDIKVRSHTLKTILDAWDDTKVGENLVPGFRSEFIKNLSNYGFTVEVEKEDFTPVDMDFESSSQQEEKDTTPERIHGISFLLSSPRTTLSSAVKRFLTTVPEYEKNDDGTIKIVSGTHVIATTLFGTPKFIEFNRVYSNLKSKLANARDVYKRLSELAEQDSLMLAVKNQLDGRIVKSGQSFDPFVAQFFTTFSLSKYKLFTTYMGFEDGNPFARVLNTDRRSQEDTIIAEWENNSIRKGLIGSDGKINDKKLVGLSKAMQDLIDKKATITYEDLKKRFNDALDAVGIELPGQVMQKLDKQKDRSKILHQWTFGDNAPSLQAFIARAEKGDNPYFETGLVSVLAERAKDFLEDISASTFLNEANNQVSAINYSSFITGEIQKLKDGDAGRAYIRRLIEDGFYRNNKFLEHVYDPAGQKTFDIKFFSAFRKSKFQDAKEQGETNIQESLFSRLTAYHNGNNPSGYIYLGTLADKGQIVAALLPKKKGNQARTLLKEALRGTVNQEIARIQRLNAKLVSEDGTMSVNDIANYKNADKFIYIPELNTIEGLTGALKDGSLDIDQLGAYEKQISVILDKFIQQEEKAFYNRLQSLGLIEQKGDIIKNIGLPEVFTGSGTKRGLEDFFMNSFAWRLEMGKVFHGDLAFYKNADQYFKRGYQIITPGLTGYINADLKSAAKLEAYNRGIFTSSMKVNNPKELLEIANLIDEKVTISQIESALTDCIKAKEIIETGNTAIDIAIGYTSIYTESGKLIKGVNKTDAQTYSTIEAHRDLMMRFGQWSDDHDFLYENAWKDGKSLKQAITFSALSPEEKAYFLALEGSVLLQPLKPFTFGNRFVKLSDGSTFVLKEQFKESITPLLPEWANKHTQFKELLEAMKRDNIHLMSDSEAVKVGSYAVNSDLTKPIVGRAVPAENMRLPLVLPSKEKKFITAGTQIEKLIVGNIQPETTYVLASGKRLKGNEIISEYHETWAEIIKQDYDKLKATLGIGDELVPEGDRLEFLKKFKFILEQELGSRSLPDNYSDALLIIKDKLDRPSFNVDIDFPALGRKYEQVITNLWKKNVINQKLPGDSLVNVADFGTPKIENSSELKFITNKDGNVEAAEVAMPYRYGEKLGLTEKNSDPVSGKIIWDSLTPDQQSRLQVIVYRIPTSDKNSTLPCKIVSILPRSSGSVIMVPGEGTKQGGFDFDLDKSNLMWRVPAGDSKSKLWNKLFDIHWAILTNKAHAEELLKPLDSKVHDEMIDYLEKKKVVNKQIANSPFNEATDLEMEKRNKYAAAMIGIFSKFAVAHATMQTIKDKVQIQVPIEIEVGDYKFDQVGRIRDNKDELISANHSAQQNSALDAAKDPKLDYLNITTFNAETLAYMTSLGVNQKLALAFMNQPIIKELSEEYFKSGSNDMEGAIDVLKAKYNGLDNLLGQASKRRLLTITPGNLDKGFAETGTGVLSNLPHQAQVLADFREYFYAAKDMSLATTALSTDTVRDMTGVAAVESFLNTVEYVTSTNSDVVIDEEVFDIKTSPVKRLAAFYEYGVKAAYKFSSQFYPYSSVPFKLVKSAIAHQTFKKNGILADKQMITMIDQAMSMVMLSEDGYINQVLDKYSPAYGNRFSYFTPQKSIVTYKDSIVRKFPKLQKNLLMQALRPDIYNDRNSTQLLTINNTHGNFDKTNLTNSWWELLTDPNPEISRFGHDLIRFAVTTTGFKMSPTSFIDLVPVQFWNESGMSSYYSGLSLAYQSGSKTINPSDLAKVVIRHNFTYPRLVPTLPISMDEDGNIKGLLKYERVNPKGTHITSFIAPKDKRFYNPATKEWIRFIKIFDRKGATWRLYEAVKDSNVFVEIQPLGDPGRYTQYTWDAQAGSNNPDHKNIKSKTKLALETSDTTESLGMTVPQFEETIDALNTYGLEYDKVIAAGPVLEKILANESNAPTQELVKKMLSRQELISDLSVSLSNELAEREAGQFDTELFSIEISERKHFTEPRLRRTLLHEIVHAYSVKAMREPSTQEEYNFNTTVERLYDRVLNKAGETKENLPYGLTNKYEFVAELASNSKFREFVRSQDSIWKNLLRALRKLFGFKDASVYKQVFDSLYEVLDTVPTLHESLAGSKKKYSLIEGGSSKVVMSKINKVLEDKMKRLKSQNRDWKSVESLLKELNKLSDKEGLIKFVKNSMEEISQVSADINKLLETPEKLSSSRIVHAQQKIGAYNVLKEIKKHIRDNPTLYKDTKIGDKSLLGVVENQIVRLSNLQEDLADVGKDLIAKLIKTNTAENVEEFYIRGQLDLADRDISILNRGLDAIINSRDIVLRTLGKLVTNGKARAYRKSEDFLKNTLIEATEAWQKASGAKTMAELNDPILEDNKANDLTRDGVYFINPLSEKGKAILARAKEDPLRRYYEAVVVMYQKRQESLPQFLRPGMRIPSIRKSSLELIGDEKGLNKLKVFKEASIDIIRKTYDESDRKTVDQDGNPIEWLPARFISKQDGTDGRMKRSEVSLDVASTVFAFIDEMNNYDEMNDIVYDLELAKDIVKRREVAQTKQKPGLTGLLSAERITLKDQQGNVITKHGETSEAYKHLDIFMRRMVFGQIKKDEGDINILGVKADKGKIADAILKYTGIRIMAGNLNIAFSNVATGEVTMLKEAVGGRWFSVGDWWRGKKLFFKEVVPYMGEWGKKKPTSKFGVVFEWLNPEDQIRDNPQLGKGTTRLSQVAKWKTLGLPNTLGNLEMQGSLMMTMLDKEKFKGPDGKEVGLYDALEVKNGKPSIKAGYTYTKNNGKFGETEIDKVRNKIVRLGQDINGIYNTLDSSGIRETAVGRLVLVMRGWLKAGVDARWRLKFYNERLEGFDEGYYLSAISFFKNMFGPEGWMKKNVANLRYLIGQGLETADLLSEEEKLLPQDQQEELASLRRANIRKFLFEMYVIAALTAISMLGWDDDEKDSFALYHIIRLKRELSTYFSPGTAWDVLRSPTVALDTIERATEFTWGIVSAPVLYLSGEDLPEYEQGINRGQTKVWVQLQNKIPIWSQRHQFDDFDKRIDLIERGWK